MADLQRLLGGMLASGMGGRSRRGPAAFGASHGRGFGGVQKTAGLGALAYLGYKAWQEYQRNNPSAAGSGSGGSTAGSGSASLGERLGSLLGMDSEPEPAPQALGDAQALLLIRAMIAAANADGEISPDERQRITARLDQAGAGAEERAVLQRELQTPHSAEQIVREVHDQETAEEVYVASRVAMNPDTPAEKAYLDFLAARLGIPAERLDALNSAA